MHAFVVIYPKEYVSEISRCFTEVQRKDSIWRLCHVEEPRVRMYRNGFCIDLLSYCHIGTYLKRVKVDAV